MTDLNSPTGSWSYSPRNVALRAICEDPTRDHATDVGVEIDRQTVRVNPVMAANVAGQELHDSVDPLSTHPRSAILRPEMDTTAIEEAMARVMAAIPEDGDRG